MTGARYEICRGCGRKWNVSVLAKMPWYGYTCPICRAPCMERAPMKRKASILHGAGHGETTSKKEG